MIGPVQRLMGTDVIIMLAHLSTEMSKIIKFLLYLQILLRPWLNRSATICRQAKSVKHHRRRQARHGAKRLRVVCQAVWYSDVAANERQHQSQATTHSGGPV